MIKCLSSKTVKTRKDHYCWGCMRLFKAGSMLFRTICIDDDGFATCYWCDICKKEAETWPEWTDEGILEGEIIEAKPELFVGKK